MVSSLTTYVAALGRVERPRLEGGLFGEDSPPPSPARRALLGERHTKPHMGGCQCIKRGGVNVSKGGVNVSPLFSRGTAVVEEERSNSTLCRILDSSKADVREEEKRIPLGKIELLVKIRVSSPPLVYELRPKLIQG